MDSVILPRSRWLDPDSDWTDGSRIRYLRCKGSGNAREVVLFSYLWSGRGLHGDQTGEHNRSGPRAAGQRQHSQALVPYIGDSVSIKKEHIESVSVDRTPRKKGILQVDRTSEKTPGKFMGR